MDLLIYKDNKIILQNIYIFFVNCSLSILIFNKNCYNCYYYHHQSVDSENIARPLDNINVIYKLSLESTLYISIHSFADIKTMSDSFTYI